MCINSNIEFQPTFYQRYELNDLNPFEQILIAEQVTEINTLRDAPNKTIKTFTVDDILHSHKLKSHSFFVEFEFELETDQVNKITNYDKKSLYYKKMRKLIRDEDDPIEMNNRLVRVEKLQIQKLIE